MTRDEMAKMEAEQLELMDELMLPGAHEFAQSIPKAFEYICDTKAKITAAMCEGREYEFKLELEKYYKAWARIWQLMALEHYNSRPIEEVDMRYYRHLPDGYSFVMDSKPLGCKIKVLPRKPADPPKDMRWITAGEMIKIHENPIILEFIKQFEGTWFDRDGDGSLSKSLQMAMEADKKNFKNKPPVLVRKKIDKGMEYYERETVRKRTPEVGQDTRPKRVRLQNKRQVLLGDAGPDDSDLG